MVSTPNEVAARLARIAATVCQQYLPAGRRQGRYWIVGDVRNTPGRSMFVRLIGPAHGRGAAGRWTDAATGEHGDLLDLIRLSLGLGEFAEVMREAGRFLSLPHAEPVPPARRNAETVRAGSAQAARRLFGISQPIDGTIAATYLRNRAIHDLTGTGALRFHPSCYYKADTGLLERRPAMIAAVTDLAGTTTGAHRTWLASDGSGKAPVDTPRRAMGQLLGHAVRFGKVSDIMAVGEGIETMLALRQILPAMPMAACLSSAHLRGLILPSTLRRLYIARDDDPAGDAACDALVQRARKTAIEPVVLSSTLQDFNDDLMLLGYEALRSSVRAQLVAGDVDRFLGPPR